MQSTRRFSGRIGKIIIFLLMLSLVKLSAEDVSPQDRDMPPWLILEKGKTYFRNKEFSTALNYFLYAQQEGAVFPEVEYWIGRIYEEEGEFLLAEEQYQKAYDQRRYLYIQDDQFEIAFRLAHVYLNRREWSNYETILLNIVHQEFSPDTTTIEQEHQFIRVLKEQGLDDLFYLYRQHFRFSINAFHELGLYYYKQDNFRSATIHMLYAVMGQVSDTIEGILAHEPDFQYPRNLEQLQQWDPLFLIEDIESLIQEDNRGFVFARIEGSEEIQDPEEALASGLKILEEQGTPYRFNGLYYMLSKIGNQYQILTYLDEGLFYQNLYFLAASLYSEGFEESAADIWFCLSRIDAAGYYQTSAKEKLRNPSFEDRALIY